MSVLYAALLLIPTVVVAVILGKLKAEAPWFVPVAYNDDVLDDWVK